MSLNCPKCNAVIDPNMDGTCPICGTQTADINLINPDFQKEEIITPMGYRIDTQALLKKRLWNPVGFIIISALFSFLPASILYAINCGRAGNSKKKTIALVIAPVLFIVLILSSIFISGSAAKTLFYGLNIGAAILMYNDQKDLFNQYKAAGGKSASYIIPVIGCAVFTGVLIFCMIYSINIPDSYMTFEGDELYYTADMDKAEVRKLGDYLVSNGVFVQDDRKISFKIDKKSGGGFIFSMIISKEYMDDPQVMSEAQLLSQSLSTDVFHNQRVEVDFCNDVFKVKKVAAK